MYSTHSQLYDDQLLARYLLGSLAEEETERLDELSITDDEFAGRLAAVENDLVDGYVRGELSGDTLEQFNSFYLSSPKRRERVRFAETLLVMDKRNAALASQDERAVPESVGPNDAISSRFSRFFELPRPALLWSFAVATLVVLLAVGFLLVENSRLRDRMNQAQAARAALQQREQELQTQLSNDAETVKELERVRERLALLEQQLAESARAGQSSSKPAILSFNLLPQTRGAGQITTIAVPAGTDFVRFQLQLESDDFPDYRVALRDPRNNQIIWRSGKLKASAKTISAMLPASLLKPQNYTLEVTGVPASGPHEFLSSYPFKAVIQ